MKKTAGIRFDADVYLNISVDEENTITLYTVDADGVKTDYTVTKTSKRSTKKKTEEE